MRATDSAGRHSAGAGTMGVAPETAAARRKHHAVTGATAVAVVATMVGTAAGAGFPVTAGVAAVAVLAGLTSTATAGPCHDKPEAADTADDCNRRVVSGAAD